MKKLMPKEQPTVLFSKKKGYVKRIDAYKNEVHFTNDLQEALKLPQWLIFEKNSFNKFVSRLDYVSEMVPDIKPLAVNVQVVEVLSLI